MKDILAGVIDTEWGFEIEYSLVASYGLGGFFSKWQEVEQASNETITDDIGYHWTSLYYKIGQDLSKEDALKDFERDSVAFDIDVNVTISKCGIVLIEDHVIGSDYAEQDGEVSAVLADLVAQYSNNKDYINKANDKLLELVEGLG